MNLSFYREREQQEHAFAAQALSAAARDAHLQMAERYRAVIEAHEQLDQALPADRSAA